MSKRIKIEDATDGMILAAGVEDKVGRPILKAGDIIKGTFIERLKRWGVDEVLVQVDGEVGNEEDNGPPPVDVGALDRKLDMQFQKIAGASHMKHVRAALRKVLLLERLDF